MLTKEGISGAQVYKDYLRPSLELIASVDLKAGILSHEKGHLEWLVKGDVDGQGRWKKRKEIIGRPERIILKGTGMG